MPHPSRAQLSERFCSYCGYPPGSKWPERPDRGCARCGIGSIVRAPARMAPHPGDPFLIVDDRFVVRAVSRSAEALLLTDRQTASGARLDSLLVADAGEPCVALMQLIKLAAAGSPPPGNLDLSTVRPPAIRVQGRLRSSLLPAGALIVLAPRRYTRRPSRLV
jgi:hypothetical protein